MMDDQDQRVKTLRRELEGWREVLVALQSVAVWDKQYYPAITSSIITFFFLLIWYLNPALLTFVSFIGIVITLSDYFIPQIVPRFYGSNNWTGTQERKYEHIIRSLVGLLGTVKYVGSTLQSMKASKPKTYFVTVTTFLIFCAWIGSSVDNLFLTYLIVLFAALYPGLRRQGVVKKYVSMVLQSLSKILRDLFPKQPSTDSHSKEAKKKE